VVAWGWNHYGQATPPDPNTGFVALAAGGHHNLGLKQDQTIVAWGCNNGGECDVPEPNTDFVAVAAGYYHSLGLRGDGSVVGWGADNHGQCTPPEPNTDFVAIAAGFYYSMGLKSDGSIVVWGSNIFGQYDVPEPNIGYAAISAGSAHGLALRLVPVAAPEITMAVDPSLWISGVYPNPCNPRTVISFGLEYDQQIRLDVFNLAGEHLGTLYRGYLTAGDHSLSWDGRDAGGRSLASATYLVRLAGKGSETTRKVMLLR
jgi:hypothetical protein